jgi:hypothetical protein
MEQYYTYDNFCAKKIKYLMHKVQDLSVLDNYAVHPLICEGWQVCRKRNNRTILPRGAAEQLKSNTFKCLYQARIVSNRV